jgi:hypothetical protein
MWTETHQLGISHIVFPGDASEAALVIDVDHRPRSYPLDRESMLEYGPCWH